MRAITSYIALLFVISSGSLFAQDTCHTETFCDACADSVIIAGCPTWTNSCGYGWVRSHGTPQMIPYTAYLVDKPIHCFYAYMWSKRSGTAGEGMFKPFNFSANHAYHIRFRISTSNAGGNVYIFAANSLSQSPPGGCGDAIPNVSQKQLIGQYSGYTNGNINVDTIVVANANYSFIWIYPQASSTGQYDLAVIKLQICPSCEGIIIYNVGTVPSGETRAGIIMAGSTAGTGGSGIVTVQPTQATTFKASNEIDILPDFSSALTTGSFLSQVVPCTFPEPGLSAVDSVQISIIQSNESAPPSSRKANLIDEPNPSDDKIKIYPTITQGIVNIAGDLSKLEKTDLKVYDQLGRNVYRRRVENINYKIEMDLSFLPNGIYFVEVISLNKKVTRRIVIGK